MRSRRRRPAEIGHGKNHAELAAFTGDFIEGYGGGKRNGKVIGWGASEKRRSAFSDDLWHLSGLDPTYAC